MRNALSIFGRVGKEGYPACQYSLMNNFSSNFLGRERSREWGEENEGEETISSPCQAFCFRVERSTGYLC